MNKRPLPDRATLKHIRHLIASVIADHKSYKVPTVCSRYGLADGTEEEAFRSKYQYVSRRIEQVPGHDVLRIARELDSEESSFELAETLRKIDERAQPTVTELTRRRILTVLDSVHLAGEIDEIEFIEKIAAINSLPAPQGSTERTMADYIRRHRFLNDDLSNRELLEQLGALTWSQGVFFRLLEEITHPLVRDHNSQPLLVSQINHWLKPDGFELQQAGTMSGSPVFSVRPALQGTPADTEIGKTIAAFNSGEIHERWTEALTRRAADPRAAITSARTLLEDVCKWILTEAGEEFPDDDDLPGFYKRLAAVLNLAPDQHTEKVFKQILGSCQSIVESLGAIRNKLGDAHSQGPKRARPQPRHAELAVNLAGTMATFLISTWEARQGEITKAKA